MSTPAAYRIVRPLSLGVTLLLFAQWPLRESGLGAAAVLANDSAQLMFALYLAAALGWAERRGAQVTLHPGGRRSRGLRVAGALLPLPWCAWLAVTSAAPAWRAVLSLEHFPESFSPGYFLIRTAALVLALVLGAECLRAARQALRGG